jgi:hypothetical protein
MIGLFSNCKLELINVDQVEPQETCMQNFNRNLPTKNIFVKVTNLIE